jgi:hypothetical protein
MTNIEKARLRALRVWAKSIGMDVEDRTTFRIIDRDSGKPQASEVFSLNAVEDALSLLTETRSAR